MSIGFSLGGAQPRVYVRIGLTVRSPIIGVRLRDGRIASEAAVMINDIADTDDAIAPYMEILGQYASTFYFCYLAKDKDAEQIITTMRTDQLAGSVLLLERYVQKRKLGAIPLLLVKPKERTKAPISGYSIGFLPGRPIPPELQASFTLGDPETRVRN